MKRAALVLLVAVAACQTPGSRLVYDFANGTAHSCGSNNCANIKIPCESVISIRILRPEDPTAPLLTICEPLPQNRNRDLCSVAAVDLGDTPIELPKETLEVQVVIWQRDDVVDPESGELDCGRYDVRFDAIDGFPIAQQPAPAIGGHAFYHPGDEEIRVTLGCTDLPALHQCSGESRLEISATVESFENIGVTLAANEGSQLTVAVGEPKLEGAQTVHTLNPTDLRTLVLNAVTPVVAVWRADVDLEFRDVACIQVLENAAQATATLTCTGEGIPPEGSTLGLGGVLLPKPTLDQVLAALGLPQFPPQGMTVGIVVDKNLGVPLAGQQIMVAGGSVRYLSADRTSVGGTQTSASGIFVSLDAPLGSVFSIQGGLEDKVGGRVQGKVTIVVLEK